MTSAAGQSRRVRRCGTGARACGSRRAALQQHGGGGDTMNERGNNENAQERGEHEHPGSRTVDMSCWAVETMTRGGSSTY